MILLDLLPVRLATDTAVAVLLEGSLLLGATWVAAALLRRHSPAARHGVWTLGFVLALVVPLVGTALPERSLGLLPYPTPSRADAGAGDAPIRTGNGAGLRAARPFPGLPDAGDVPGLERAALTPPPPEPGRADRIGASLATGFWLLWGAGALALVLRLGGHRIRVGRLTARGAPVPAGDLPARIARREAARMGIRRRVRVVYTDELPVPVTWGVVRPRLLLPPDAASWSETRLRAVTVHELAHVRRWDALSQQLAELARALYWANPLVWVARRLAAREREWACDDEVLRRGMPSSDYAAVLLEMARRGTDGPGRTLGLERGLALVGTSRLEARVAAILRRGSAGAPRNRAALLATSAALLAVAAPLAATSPTGEPAVAGPAPAISERLRTVWALGLECDEISLWALTKTLQEDPSSAVRTAAARALGRHDDPRSVAVLTHAATDTTQDRPTRRASLRALGHRDSPRAAEALMATLRSDDPGIRRAAVEAMGRMRRQSPRVRGPVAITMLRDRDAGVRGAAAAALRRVGCDDSVPWLREALKDSSDAVVRRAKNTLESLAAR